VGYSQRIVNDFPNTTTDFYEEETSESDGDDVDHGNDGDGDPENGSLQAAMEFEVIYYN
jgi:hypothetical protein